MINNIMKVQCLINYFTAEYGFGSKLSTEGDVYSYGITILEMLTGKRPTDEMFSEGLTLHKFVGEAFPQKIHEILDPSIIPVVGDGDNHTMDGITRTIMNLIKLGISCSAETPKDRPTMKDVYAKVITIKETFSELCH
jgi:serine/threonine protein kinase